MTVKTFTCKSCGDDFSLKTEVLARYPGWTPSVCLKCRDKSRGPSAKRSSSGTKGRPAQKRPRRSSRQKGSAKEEHLPVAAVLEKYSEGPYDGIFTDGACSGNPGPGGWGVVWVRNNEVLQQDYGHEDRTTNNRMELRALIAAYSMVPDGAELDIWSDSNLCVRTVNEWAAGWQKRGWRRKTGPVENLDLVKEAFQLSRKHPGVTLRWIKAHNGSRWNEYADALATAFLRDEL